MDTGYKLLFSNPRLVQDLLEGFIQPDWLADIDFSTLEPVKASFATDDLRQRHDDSIWRVRVRDERWLYVYLLLEFQSTDDYFMACRIMTYVGLLYQDIIRSESLGRGAKLPPVLPVVIYNGTRPWRSPEAMSALVEPVFGALQAYVPEMRYQLLQEQEVPEKFAEEHPDNILGHIIGLGLSEGHADMRHRVHALNRLLTAPEQQPLARAVTVWLNRLLRVKFKQEALTELQSLSEVEHMLAEKLERWVEEWKREGLEAGREKGLLEGREVGLQEGREVGLQEGREVGLQEGRQEGRREEAANLLLRMISKRFGAVDEAFRQRIENAELEALEAWSERLFDIESADELFREV